MTIDLRDRLDDLVAGVPDHVTADAGTAWRAGTRRRTRRRTLAGAAAVGLALLAIGPGLGLGPVPGVLEPAGQPGTRDLTHPSRIEQPWRTSELAGDRTAPIAGWVRRGDQWQAVSPHGELLSRDRIDPENLASVSPNGRKVAYVSINDDTGDAGLGWSNLVHAIGYGWAAVTPGSDTTNQQFVMSSGEQVWWSPDSVRLAVPISQVVDGGAEADVAVFAGSTLTLRVVRPTTDVELVGWTSADALGWFDGRSVISTSFRDGRTTGTVTLDPAPPPYAVAALSTAGDGTLAVVSADADARLYVYGPDGALDGTRDMPRDWAPGCPLSWAGSQPWVPTLGRDGAVILDGGAGGRIIADPRLDVTCSTWASSALDGQPYDGLRGRAFGDTDSWWSWYARELALALLLIPVAGAVVLVRRRRQRRYDRLLALSES